MQVAFLKQKGRKTVFENDNNFELDHHLSLMRTAIVYIQHLHYIPHGLLKEKLTLSQILNCPFISYVAVVKKQVFFKTLFKKIDLGSEFILKQVLSKKKIQFLKHSPIKVTKVKL